MKVSGFTFVRNAIKFDYPVVESINSILPLCNELIVSVGNSEDDTLGLIKSIPSDKIKIFESIWDDSLRTEGRVLAIETNKAFAKISTDSDWAFYLQADEVIHEKDYHKIQNAMRQWKNDKKVEGLLFNYTHFYGSYDYIGDSRKWYRKEIRIIRNNKAISSWKDAISFRKGEKKLNVKQVDASIFHYGWAKPPDAQQKKQHTFHKMWHDDKWLEKHIANSPEYDYTGIDSLREFTDTHPAVMLDRIKQKNWIFNYNPAMRKLSSKDKLLLSFEQLTGWRIGEYKNYKMI